MTYPKNKAAKIFLNGNSQAVRLPKEFRFKDSEVNISFHGNSVLLSPIPMSQEKLPQILEQFNEDFKQYKTQQIIY